jgi:hypothetical protein
LLHRSLLDPGEYYPLSYVWGDAADRAHYNQRCF